MSRLRLVIAPLAPQHDRAGFACGKPALDDYLRRRAGQDVRRQIARVFVATEPGSPVVAGYYALSGFAVALADMPPDLARKLPPHGDVPAALIGRLARDLRYRGRGVGEILLADALRRILDAGRTLGIHAIVVDAIDDEAKAFTLSCGFVAASAQSRRLILPAATAARAAGLAPGPGRDDAG